MKTLVLAFALLSFVALASTANRPIRGKNTKLTDAHEQLQDNSAANRKPKAKVVIEEVVDTTAENNSTKQKTEKSTKKAISTAGKVTVATIKENIRDENEVDEEEDVENHDSYQVQNSKANKKTTTNIKDDKVKMDKEKTMGQTTLTPVDYDETVDDDVEDHNKQTTKSEQDKENGKPNKDQRNDKIRKQNKGEDAEDDSIEVEGTGEITETTVVAVKEESTTTTSTVKEGKSEYSIKENPTQIPASNLKQDLFPINTPDLKFDPKRKPNVVKGSSYDAKKAHVITTTEGEVDYFQKTEETTANPKPFPDTTLPAISKPKQKVMSKPNVKTPDASTTVQSSLDMSFKNILASYQNKINKQLEKVKIDTDMSLKKAQDQLKLLQN